MWDSGGRAAEREREGERGREREREGERGREREGEKERERERERERMFGSYRCTYTEGCSRDALYLVYYPPYLCVSVKERESLCVCERERGARAM